MLGKKFQTLEEWTDFMKGKFVYVIKEGHPNYREKCRFIEMVGAHNIINHPLNLNGQAIRMRVQTVTKSFLMLKPGEFWIDDSKTPIHFLNGKSYK